MHGILAQLIRFGTSTGDVPMFVLFNDGASSPAHAALLADPAGATLPSHLVEAARACGLPCVDALVTKMGRFASEALQIDLSGGGRRARWTSAPSSSATP